MTVENATETPPVVQDTESPSNIDPPSTTTTSTSPSNDNNESNEPNDDTTNNTEVENEDQPTTAADDAEDAEEERQDIIPDRIFVGNLPYEVTEDDVRNLTPEFDVVSVEIPRKNFFNRAINKIVLQSKGYGFITYTNPEDAKKAIDSIEGKAIAGREIYAKYALPQNKNRFRSLSGNSSLNNSNSEPPNQQNPYPNNYKKGNFYPNNNNNNNGNYNGHYNMRNGAPPPHQQNGQPNYFYPPPNGNYYPGSPQQTPNGGVFKPNPHAAAFFPTLNSRNVKPFYPTSFNGQPQSQQPPHVQSQQQSQTTTQRFPRTKEEKQKKLERGFPSTTTVFVGNLDRNVTIEDLRNYMKDLNPVWIKVPRKTLPTEVYKMLKSNGVQIQNKGIAFVRFENEENQKKAIELFNGDEWNGKKLNVTIAIDSTDEKDGNIVGEAGETEEIEGDHQAVEVELEGTDATAVEAAVDDIVETAVEEADEDDDDIEIEVTVSD